MTTLLSTRDKILLCAKELIQTHGYNGFSFRDIAEDIGIRNASIHYYYPAKTDLALAVATKFRRDFNDIIQKLTTDHVTAVAILSAYADLFEVTLKEDNKLCLCGMLATEVSNLNSELRVEVQAFFNAQNKFLTDVLLKGQSEGNICPSLDAGEFAKAYLATLEGAMMLARLNDKPTDIGHAARQMLKFIKTPELAPLI